MDKFGIFKLLNSFFNFNGQETNPDSSQTGGFNLENLLSSINNSAQNPSPPKAPETQNLKRQTPLQADMLSTMNSHDAFIKRVKEKNSTNK